MDRETVEDYVEEMKDVEGIRAILLYGSRVEGRVHERSDWDICLVAPDRDSWEVVKDAWQVTGAREEVDIHTFKELTLQIKKRIIDNHEVLWKEEGFRIGEYFVKFRRMWKDTAKARGVS